MEMAARCYRYAIVCSALWQAHPFMISWRLCAVLQEELRARNRELSHTCQQNFAEYGKILGEVNRLLGLGVGDVLVAGRCNS